MTARPTTLRAWLPSSGYRDGRATAHKFVRFEEVAPDTIKTATGPHSMAPGQALIYACEETGAERRWGIW